MQHYPAWFVVADGGGARFFVRPRPELPLEELAELAETPDHIDRRQARKHDDVGHGRHAVLAGRTPHEQREQTFLRRVAGQIDRAVIENAVHSLVLCAPPRALGLLRDFISDNARARISCEINTDAVKEPVGRIDERMKEHHV